ncbi:glycohydrolase toxin TNT-related protein [Actinomadura viridis]|uniref:glycohydrolase toxin TNT-related protein n=1 Tax=Actinomadura viridis TaxID=58110 RepID=UPI0036AA0301
MNLTEEEINGRLDEVAELTRALLPPGRDAASLIYHALGSFETARLICHQAGGDMWTLPRSDVFESLRDLRRDCHTPETGTWSVLRLDFHSQGGWEVATEPLEDFRWKSEVTAADCARELAEFPRPPSLVPEWMARLADAQRDADAFDPETILRRPLLEGELPGEDGRHYFERARAKLRAFLPADHERVRFGRLEEGCWSVVPSGTSWLAVHHADGRADPVVAFPEFGAALVHAAARVLVESGLSVDSALLRAADVLHHKKTRAGVDAWVFGDAGRDAHDLTSFAPRPSMEAESEPSIALGPLSNRPGGYFVCRPGPPPEKGSYITARKVFELALARELPPAPSARGAKEARQPSRVRPRMEPVRPAPRYVLPVGTYVDAYEHHDQNRVYRIGTPWYRRGQFDRTKEDAYHVYRVEKPLLAAPTRLAAFPTTSEEEMAERAGTDQGQGYHLGSDIDELVRSGHLREMTGSGGEPVPEPGRVVTEVRRTYEMSQPASDAGAVRQQPRPFDQERYDELQSRLGRILAQIAPQGWRRIDLQIRMTTAVSEVALTVLKEDGSYAEVEPPRNLTEIAAELRSMMYLQDRGTWFSMRFMMDPPDAYWTSFNTDFDPFWDPPVPAKVWEHDLRVFPRSAEHIPGWLRESLEADD